MASNSKLASLDLRAFAESVSARAPIPGSGSVAALIGALGASAASMAFRHASGEGESTAHAYMEGRVEELDELRELLLLQIDRDAEAFEKLAGAADVRAAGEAAFDAPLETLESALAALRLLAVGLKHVPEPLLPEGAVALVALEASIVGASAVCKANLSLLAPAVAEQRGGALAFLRSQAAALAAEIRAALVVRGTLA